MFRIGSKDTYSEDFCIIFPSEVYPEQDRSLNLPRGYNWRFFLETANRRKMLRAFELLQANTENRLVYSDR